jgi:hypothetical protein
MVMRRGPSTSHYSPLGAGKNVVASDGDQRRRQSDDNASAASAAALAIQRITGRSPWK